MSSPGAKLLDSKIIEAVTRYQDGEKSAIDDIYGNLLPFCLRVASKTENRYITIQDEESSIAQIALLEVFEKYQPDRGSFYAFLGQVIRNRIIDYKRKENRSRTIPFSDLGENRDSYTEPVAEDYFEKILDDLARQQEIEKLRNMLGEYQISFEDLYKVSPKQLGAREKAMRVARIIAESIELSEHLFAKKSLPARVLEEKFAVNHKLLDRYRKYIIAGVLILKYEFSYLKSYVLPLAGGDDID
ncbi:MAG: sigma factor [Syntrophomonas sp.]|nr:sigma factor [Syntrophomonas sp.]